MTVLPPNATIGIVGGGQLGRMSALAAARLGWRIEETACLGLHAAPFATALPHLAPGARLICLLRDAAENYPAWLDAIRAHLARAEAT